MAGAFRMKDSPNGKRYVLPCCCRAGLEVGEVGKSNSAMPSDHTVRDFTAVERADQEGPRHVEVVGSLLR